MRKLIIKNLGPLAEVEFSASDFNIIIGTQSSGKSCILKMACYCAWVEKRLALTQNLGDFANGDYFIKQFAEYYDMASFVSADTFIEYESGYMKYSYDHATKKFQQVWKSNKWHYKRPRITYIPADRNLVAVIPGWKNVNLDDNMIEFMSLWDEARKSVEEEENVLNLGMTYEYDAKSNKDSIRLKDGAPIPFKESSSGVQSLIPMYVIIDYLTSKIYNTEKNNKSYIKKTESDSLIQSLHNYFGKLPKKVWKEDEPIVTKVVSKQMLSFASESKYQKFIEVFERLSKVYRSEIFLEEPEDNLFPPTQFQFVDWVTECIRTHNDTLFIATHSPYVLDRFLKEKPDQLRVMFTHPSKDKPGKYSVKTLTKDELDEVYGDGVDLFFNFEMYL